jgi:hypothetical protein
MSAVTRPSLDRRARLEIHGEGFMAFLPRHGTDSRVPKGITPVAGPLVVGAGDYDSLEIGQYYEMFVAEPARLRHYVGMSVTTMAVSTRASKDLGIETWGFPKKLGTISLVRDGRNEFRFRWDERRIEFAFRRLTPALAPFPPTAYALQWKEGVPVVIPSRAYVRTGLASVDISVPGDDELSHLNGHYPALYLTGRNALLDAREV